MKSKKWYSGVIVAAVALSLAGADLALAQGWGGGRGQRGGACPMYQSGQGPGSGPMVQAGQPGQGQRRGQGRQQRLRDGSCPYNTTTPAPAATPTPPPAN